MRIGIIGTGRIASRFVDTAFAGIESAYVSCVYNPKAASAEKFAIQHRIENYTDSLEELTMLTDAVYIASLHETHYEYAKYMLNNKKHVLCEKPAVLKKAQAEELYSLAKENNVVFMEAVKTAYCPGFHAMMAAAKSGKIGRIIDVEAAFSRLTPVNTREYMAQDYNATLNLPKTAFPMRGNLPKREPDVLGKWEEQDLYEKMVQKNQGRPMYVLHDGPPYANGEIHLGTALNKVLKDFIIKYKNMSGFCAPYVPGWDTHGLPIELKALKSIGVENGAISPVELRKHCKNFAMKHVQNQMKQFKRLGSLGHYCDPYLTLKPEYEARQVEVFGEMAKRGYMYKGLKPVYWCPDCQTALAEAEIEYENDPCDSIYVKFQVMDDKGVFSKLGIDPKQVYFVIWTTTTWTIPGNLAVCVGPDYEYTLVKAGSEYYCMAV